MATNSSNKIKQAAEAAGTLDPKPVAKMMHSGMNFKTVLGELSFDANGDVSNTGYSVSGKQKGQYVLYRWRKTDGGRITYFESE